MATRKKINAAQVESAANEMIEAKVRTKANLFAALPLVFDVRQAAAEQRKWAKDLEAIADELAEQATAYVADHIKALDEPLAEFRGNIENGTVEIGGVTYRLTVSPDAPKRIDGGTLNQDFLESLPEGWTKRYLKLLVSALKDETDGKLEEYGLKRDVKRVWSVVE